MRYLYGMRLRPFGIGCQPSDGLIGCEDGQICDESKDYWDVISYTRKLTKDEEAQYELDYIACAEDSRGGSL